MTFKYQKYLNVEKLSKNAINKTIKNIYVMKNRVSEKKIQIINTQTHFLYQDGRPWKI